ncbi:MAG: aminotransferase class III-fold pyridoxal phosphate-dependent enzyme [Acidobacteria bacterium]|nr:aminotransferase class III-fold pyridoxal phosphate-dependent enzyme [Acidobacteriota bacterium]
MPAITFDLPSFTGDQAVAAAQRLYGFSAVAESLPSERDQNFVLRASNGERFVFKISNATEDPQTLDLQNQALRHVAQHAPELTLPRVCPSLSGRLIEALTDDRGRSHQVRLLTWVPGTVFAHATPHLPDLVYSLGRYLGQLDTALESFDHPATDRDLKWDPRKASWIGDHVQHVADPARRELVTRVAAWADTEIAKLAPSLRVGVIYNDANDYNVLVAGVAPYDTRVVSVVDFGDMLRTWTVNEVAVACAYALLDKADPLSTMASAVAGYHEARRLTEAEIDAVFPLICSRLAVSVVNAAIQQHAEPGNQYLVISERPAWDALTRLACISPAVARATLRAACGLEPYPATPRVVSWLRASASAMGPVLDPDPRSAATVVLDLGVGSAEAGTPRLWADVEAFSRDLFGRMARSGATVGIGRYDEVRAFYSSDIFSTPGNDGPAWRTVHLGADLFVLAGTPVLAPLDGIVKSVADNAGELDYGPTVILEHRAGARGDAFYTLYGHLARESVKPLREGQAVRRGTPIAVVGTPAENGGWPPHLHFQIITDLLGPSIHELGDEFVHSGPSRHGDYPGVARPSERRVWLSLSPDPNLILQIPGGVTAPARRSTSDILAGRREHIGPSLSVSYHRPLTIVRGWMQHLYDADGQVYLDAVNNVPHVGHCHPHVVEAGQRQMAVLNTNTRYLHDTLTQYADRLCAMLPDPLRVCFFVNSGSEANELALRLARAFTDSRETIVVDVGYHGNTTSLVEISPYKFDGPGGSGAAPHIHKVPTPDVYRGLYRRPARDAGKSYASHVGQAVETIVSRGRRPGAFIAESILSCAGQIVLPPGYLTEAYRYVRDAGGVCIADEVQVGFGRVGTHVWAFETQGVVPDILTLGKPIGNGHPLGAVITTRDIAQAFANGMEYFNTFGGNPVSCAIGMAVLDVMERERLQHQALRVGTHLLSGLRDLKSRYRALGDVRGLGLFIGVELVLDRETLAPAGSLAGTVANRMRDRGVLVSTDGPFHNVLKIKPPLVFTVHDADVLVAALDHVLGETEDHEPTT